MDNHPSEGIARFLGALTVGIVGTVVGFRVVKMAASAAKAIMEMFKQKEEE